MAKDKDKKKKDRHSHPAKAAGKRGAATGDEKAGATGDGTAAATAAHAASDVAGGQHHAAKAHGHPAKVDGHLPATRPELMARHAAARGRRNAAPLGSEAFRAAVDEIARIEVRIAAVDRAADPPLG